MIMSESDLRFFFSSTGHAYGESGFYNKNYFGIICLFRNNSFIQNEWIGNGVAKDLRHSSTWKPKIIIGQRCFTAQYCVLWSCSPCRAVLGQFLGVAWRNTWTLRKTEQVGDEATPQCSVSTAILQHKTRSWPSVIPQYLNASFSSQEKFQLRKIQLIFYTCSLKLQWSIIKPLLSLLEVNMFSATQSNSSCYIFVVRSLLCIAPNQEAQHPVPRIIQVQGVTIIPISKEQHRKLCMTMF